MYDPHRSDYQAELQARRQRRTVAIHWARARARAVSAGRDSTPEFRVLILKVAVRADVYGNRTPRPLPRLG